MSFFLPSRPIAHMPTAGVDAAMTGINDGDDDVAFGITTVSVASLPRQRRASGFETGHSP